MAGGAVMAKDTKIAWADSTFNPWWGCKKISTGCKFCYAEALAVQLGYRNLWSGQFRTFGDKIWNEPVRWNRLAKKKGVPSRVFCGSMCDIFQEDLPENIQKERQKLFSLINTTPWLDWMMLTKRAKNAALTLGLFHKQPLPNNLWIGVTIEGDDAQTADQNVSFLTQIPAFLRFISFEPLLGGYIPDLRNIDWIIIGGESQSTRIMEPDWVDNLIEKARNTKPVPPKIFFKQAGSALASRWGMSGKGDNLNELPQTYQRWKLEEIPNGSSRKQTPLQLRF